KEATGITLTPTTGIGAVITWTASTEPGVAGYYVYRADSEFGEYKLRSGLVTGTSFTDGYGTDGKYWYMVRATKVQNTPSGSYYNLSLGIAGEGTFQYPQVDVGVEKIQAISDIIIAPNPAQHMTQLHIKSTQTINAKVTITDVGGK